MKLWIREIPFVVLTFVLGFTVLALASCVTNRPNPAAEPTPLATDQADSGAVQFTTYFAKDGQHPESVVINDVKSAKTEVVTAMYSFTQPDIWAAYEALPAKHIPLTLLTDQSELSLNAAQRNGVANLCSQGVKVRKNIAKGRVIEHLKLTVIDGRIGLAGSYNYTVSATTGNDEILIRYVSPTYVSPWRDHITRMYNDPAWSVDACQPSPTLVPSPGVRRLAGAEGE